MGDRMPFDQLHRREFIALLGGAAAWPFAARAQQGERLPLIAVRTGMAEIRRPLTAGSGGS
jgi:hypothetical protein